MQKITTFLTYDGRAEEAVNLYVSLFPRSKITQVTRYGDTGPGPKGSVMVMTFELDGQPFYALNGGPSFTFTQGISLFVSCDTQEEVDRLWESLSEGGKKIQCGWLVDRFGVSWQIVPKILMELTSGPDKAKSERVMKAMMGMVKLDIAGLKRAAEG